MPEQHEQPDAQPDSAVMTRRALLTCFRSRETTNDGGEDLPILTRERTRRNMVKILIEGGIWGAMLGWLLFNDMRYHALRKRCGEHVPELPQWAEDLRFVLDQSTEGESVRGVILDPNMVSANYSDGLLKYDGSYIDGNGVRIFEFSGRYEDVGLADIANIVLQEGLRDKDIEFWVKCSMSISVREKTIAVIERDEDERIKTIERAVVGDLESMHTASMFMDPDKPFTVQLKDGKQQEIPVGVMAESLQWRLSHGPRKKRFNVDGEWIYAKSILPYIYNDRNLQADAELVKISDSLVEGTSGSLEIELYEYVRSLRNSEKIADSDFTDRDALSTVFNGTGSEREKAILFSSMLRANWIDHVIMYYREKDNPESIHVTVGVLSEAGYQYTPVDLTGNWNADWEFIGVEEVQQVDTITLN